MNYFAAATDKHTSILSLNYYPLLQKAKEHKIDNSRHQQFQKSSKSVEDGEEIIRIAEHTDVSMLTIVSQHVMGSSQSSPPSIKEPLYTQQPKDKEQTDAKRIYTVSVPPNNTVEIGTDISDISKNVDNSRGPDGENCSPSSEEEEYMELQVYDARGGCWRGVPYIEGALIVNIGDCLQDWSRGLLRSALHRVVSTKKKNPSTTGRHSRHGHYRPHLHSASVQSSSSSDSGCKMKGWLEDEEYEQGCVKGSRENPVPSTARTFSPPTQSQQPTQSQPPSPPPTQSQPPPSISPPPTPVNEAISSAAGRYSMAFFYAPNYDAQMSWPPHISTRVFMTSDGSSPINNSDVCCGAGSDHDGVISLDTTVDTTADIIHYSSWRKQCIKRAMQQLRKKKNND